MWPIIAIRAERSTALAFQEPDSASGRSQLAAGFGILTTAGTRRERTPSSATSGSQRPGNFVSVEEFEALTRTEKRWLWSRLRLLRERDSWVMGTFAEYVVADALPDATHRPSSIAEWDLTWKQIKIEVKCSTQRQAGATAADKPSAEVWRVPAHYAWDEVANDWHPGERRRWTDVYVLARHEGFDHLQGWSFYVAPCSWLNTRHAETVTGATLRRAAWGPHLLSELATSISAFCKA